MSRSARMPSVRPASALASIALASIAAVDDSYAQARIGRLFSSPEQRLELDRLRNESGVEGNDAEDAESPAGLTRAEFSSELEEPLPALAVTFNGIVIRSDGHHVAWVDGVETPAGATTPAGARIEADRATGGRLRIRVSDGRTSTVLAPGQFVDETGGVRDAYERRLAEPEAGAPRERTADSHGGEAGAGIVAPAVAAESVPPSLPANLVWKPPPGMRSDSVPSGSGRSDIRPAGGGQRRASDSTMEQLGM